MSLDFGNWGRIERRRESEVEGGRRETDCGGWRSQPQIQGTHHIQLYESGLLLSSRDFTYGEDTFIRHVANMQHILERYRPNKRQIHSG